MKGEIHKMTKFTTLTTNTAVKVVAVLLLIACSFTCMGSVTGAVFMNDTLWAGGNNDLNSSESFAELRTTESSIAYDYAAFITGSYAGRGAEIAKDNGSTIPYLGYWTNYEDAWSYDSMQDRRNLAIQVYDLSSGGVTYDENGGPVYADKKAADDKRYMYDNFDKASFLLDSSDAAADERVYNEIRDDLHGIQLMPQLYAQTAADAVDTDDPYYDEFYDEYGDSYTVTEYVDGVNMTRSSQLTEQGTYGMEIVGAKVYRDGMPEQRLNGTLLFDSDQIADGDRVSSKTPEDVKGYTIAIMHRNGMVSFCTLRDPLKYMDKYWFDHTVFKLLVPVQNALIPTAIISGILALALFVFLMIAAGRRAATATGEGNDNEKGFYIAERRTDRIPFDLLFVLVCCVIGAIMGIFALAVNATAASAGTGARLSAAYPIVVTGIIATVISAAIGAGFLMSCAVRFKLGKWWRNTLCWKFCAWAWHLCGKTVKKVLGPAAATLTRPVKVLAKQAVKAIGSIGVQWKLAAATAVILIANLFVGYNAYWHGGMLLLMIIADIFIFLVILAIGLMLRRLQKGGEALAAGDLDAKVDTEKMIGDFKRHGDDLNSISEGMAKAIDQRMRSERLKTELITNVSHDIKTPLTSIVNYVDLLSKEDLEGMPAEYVEVLQRQSARLKKLTEDLVEASKAATGNINVDLKKIDIRETVNQAVGEYSEKLEKAALDVVVDAPDTPVMAEADGRLLWRVLDNLLSNVCKYSMKGTRVYITVSETGAAGVTAGTQHTAARGGMGGIVRVEVKNISRDRLNVSAEDLMERFVRGDSSRTSATEGSGLGLNIAKSLTELQGGRFRLTVDGDLFKAEVTLRK